MLHNEAVEALADLTDDVDVRGMICLLLTDHLMAEAAVSRDEAEMLTTALASLRQVVAQRARRAGRGCSSERSPARS